MTLTEQLAGLPGAGRDLDALVVIHVFGGAYATTDMEASAERMTMDGDPSWARAKDYSTDITCTWKVFCTARSWPDMQRWAFFAILANILEVSGDSYPYAMRHLNEVAVCQAAVLAVLLEKQESCPAPIQSSSVAAPTSCARIAPKRKYRCSRGHVVTAFATYKFSESQSKRLCPQCLSDELNRASGDIEEIEPRARTIVCARTRSVCQ